MAGISSQGSRRGDELGSPVLHVESAAVLTQPTRTANAPQATSEGVPPDHLPSDSGVSRRRFTLAAVLGLLVATPAYLSVLWGGRLNPLRTYYSDRVFSNFYDLQARALFHGHWYVPKGSLHIEAFIAHGHEYTYFGPFPALLRMPILAVTSSLDGRLTAPSMLVAWIVTGLFTCLLLWRVRILLRGTSPLGRVEAGAYGALIATVMSGSVLLYLAEVPLVYNEDLAWGVAMTIAALFALLGVLEQPSVRRVAVTGALILATNLARSTLGWACVIGAVLAAVWLARGHGGRERRRWWRHVLAAGLIPLVANMYVTWAKFGMPFGLPMSSQVWTQIDVHRRQFLAANGGRAFNVRFLPSTLLAYLRPDGIRLTPVFPFVTLPPAAPRAVSGVVLDQTYRTASILASMPLLTLLASWGLVASFFGASQRGARLLRIPLLTAGAGISGVLVWGYVANRYLADFVPLLCLGSAVGLVDLWHRIEAPKPRAAVRSLARRPSVGRNRLALSLGVVALAFFGIVANVGIASAPTNAIVWRGPPVRRYVHRQETLSRLTGHPLSRNVVRGSRLPVWAPADQLFVLNRCAALYLSDGEIYRTWIPVDFGPGLREVFDITFHQAPIQRISRPLIDIGQSLVSTVLVEQLGSQMRLTVIDPLYPTTDSWMPVELGRPYRVTIDADTQLHTVAISVAGREVIATAISTGEDRVLAHPLEPGDSGPPPLITVVSRPTPQSPLCRSLR